jgi:hypothetical protein
MDNLSVVTIAFDSFKNHVENVPNFDGKPVAAIMGSMPLRHH